MYKISDFTSEIGRKTVALFQNHLFLIFFIFFILFIGTFGIWVTPLLVSDDVTFEKFANSFNSLSLVSFSLPLLVTLIFDKIVSVIAKPDKENTAIIIWFSFLFLVAGLVISLLFVLGYKNDGINFSWFSFIAWLLVLYIWILGNVDNPNYQKDENGNAPTGGNDVSRSKMGRG